MLRTDVGGIALKRDLENDGDGMSVLDFDEDLPLIETKIQEFEQIYVLKQKERTAEVISILHNDLVLLFWIFYDDDVVSTFLREGSDL